MTLRSLWKLSEENYALVLERDSVEKELIEKRVLLRELVGQWTGRTCAALTLL